MIMVVTAVEELMISQQVSNKQSEMRLTMSLAKLKAFLRSA